MVYRSRFLDSAARELERIVASIASYNADSAAALLQHLESQLDLICSGTVSYGLSRMPELAQLGYRCALLGDYLFLYYIESDEVVVAHFFHQRQDYARHVLSRQSRGAATDNDR